MTSAACFPTCSTTPLTPKGAGCTDLSSTFSPKNLEDMRSIIGTKQSNRVEWRSMAPRRPRSMSLWTVIEWCTGHTDMSRQWREWCSWWGRRRTWWPCASPPPCPCTPGMVHLHLHVHPLHVQHFIVSCTLQYTTLRWCVLLYRHTVYAALLVQLTMPTTYYILIHSIFNHYCFVVCVVSVVDIDTILCRLFWNMSRFRLISQHCVESID